MKNTISIIFVVLSLIACGQGDSKNTEVQKSQLTAVEVNLQVLDLSRQGRQIEALKLGENFLRSGTDPEGSLHSTLARIYADLGDTESSVRHLQKVNATVGNLNTTVTVTRHQVSVPQGAPALPPSVSAGVAPESGAASAAIGPNGIEVRAGGASASVRN